MNTHYPSSRIIQRTNDVEHPIAYVHGSFSSPSAWRSILAASDGTNQSILTTLYRADTPPRQSASEYHHINRDVALVEDMITNETNNPVHLVAHSYGGVVALAVALAARIEVRSYTLFEPLPLDFLRHTGDGKILDDVLFFLKEYEQAFENGEPWAARRVLDLWGGAGTFDSFPEKIREALAAMTALNIQQWFANLTFRPALEEFNRLSIPITLVHGENTHPWCKLINERLNNLLPNSRLIEVASASHFLIQSHPGICANIIEQDMCPTSSVVIPGQNNRGLFAA